MNSEVLLRLRRLGIILGTILLTAGCERKSDSSRSDAAIKMVSDMRFDNKLHIDSVPSGATVIYYPGNGESADGTSRVLGETPIVIAEPPPKPGRILIAFKTQKLSQQLSQVVELREVVSEFTREMNDRRSSFAAGSYAAIFYSSQYFKFPGDATQALVGKDGELVSFGPVFDYDDKGFTRNRFVAWALPKGKSASLLFPFMSPKGTYVAAKSDSSVYGIIPREYWSEAQECISRCGYYTWIGEGKAQDPYVALTAQAMAAGRLSLIHQMYSSGKN